MGTSELHPHFIVVIPPIGVDNKSKFQVHKKKINLFISKKYIEYPKLFHHPYRNLEYEQLKKKSTL
jgi:hypothetical protein